MKSLLVCIALPVAGASSLGHKLSDSAPSVELSLESSAHPLPELSSDLGELEATREGEESVSNACAWSTIGTFVAVAIITKWYTAPWADDPAEALEHGDAATKGNPPLT